MFAADHATGITIETGGMTGAPDVLDAENIPFGSWLSRSAGGWLGVGAATGSNASNMSAHGDGADSHALLFGLAGERNARVALDFDGSMWYGAGDGPFETTVRPPTSASVLWDPPALEAGGVATLEVEVAGAVHGALCVVSHEAMGDAYVASAGGLPVLSGFVVSAGKVLAVLKNEGVVGMDVGPGKLSVVATAVE